MAKVTGIGGIFFKSKNDQHRARPPGTQKHLGLPLGELGWRDSAMAGGPGRGQGTDGVDCRGERQQVVQPQRL